MASIGVVIMAGGSATRMGGVDKGLLRLNGRNFLDILLEQVRHVPELLLSVDRPDRYPDCPATRIVDAAPGNGPLQGLAQALDVCRSDALLALAVDMPLFEYGLARYLAAFFRPGTLAVAARDRTGRRHPLCALYSKRAAPVLHRQLAANNLKLRDALALLDAVDAPLEHSAYPDAMLANVNSPEQFAALRSASPPVLAICGVKNSGKTTLLARLIPLLRRRGLRLGVIKHDAHDFTPDVPGTDSFRLREAGAERVAVYSPARLLFTSEGGETGPDALLPAFAGLDLVLFEGGKRTALPKLEVVRASQGGRSVSNPANLLAVCADAPVETDAPVLPLNDGEAVCRFICETFLVCRHDPVSSLSQ